MNDLFNGLGAGSGWFIPIISALILLPVLVIVFNEFLFRANTSEKRLVPPVKLLRNYIIPLIAVFIIVNQLLGVARATTVIKIIETLIYILIVNALLAIINVFFFSSGEQSLVKTKIPQLFLDIFRVLMVLLGTAIIFSVVWGADLGSLITALGVGSFVLGLALQDTLGNLFAGIALIYEKPFKVGDNIKIGDWTGRVTELNWRAVRIISSENVMMVIPHLISGGATILNYSAPTKTHTIERELGFSYDHPPNKVKAALLNTVIDTPGVLRDPLPRVETVEFADSSITYSVTFSVAAYEDRHDVSDEFMTKIWYMMQRFQFDMPYPHLDIVKSTEESKISKSKDEQLTNDLKGLLKLIPIREDQIDEIKVGTNLLQFGIGEFIVTTNDVAGKIYFLKSGHVKVMYSDENKTKERFLFAGDFFGEVTMQLDWNCSFSVKVMEDVEVLVIEQKQVMNMIEDNPKLAFYLDQDARLETSVPV